MRGDLPDIQRVIEIIAERKIEEAMQEGKFDNLPGKGKPLPMDEEWFVPPEMRPAVRLLKSAGVLPDWLEYARQIEEVRAECQRCWQRAEREYPRICQQPLERYTLWLEQRITELRTLMERVNQLILVYNCCAPATANPQIPYRVQIELQRFRACFPYPTAE
ncbi:MAG: DUF1992 domain-containing protein [Armatimonadota bacterium]